MQKQKETMTVTVDPVKRKQLDKIAARNNRPRSAIVDEAIGNYIELDRYQVNQIRKGLEEAKRGEFASEKEVRRALRR